MSRRERCCARTGSGRLRWTKGRGRRRRWRLSRRASGRGIRFSAGRGRGSRWGGCGRIWLGLCWLWEWWLRGRCGHGQVTEDEFGWDCVGWGGGGGGGGGGREDFVVWVCGGWGGGRGRPTRPPRFLPRPFVHRNLPLPV